LQISGPFRCSIRKGVHDPKSYIHEDFFQSAKTIVYAPALRR
jgi:hypothetical protein